MLKNNAEFNAKLAAVIMTMGYEFIGYEIGQVNRQKVLRIYVDNCGAVSTADCSLISRQISAMLDVEDIITGRYILEISSPGIARPLFTALHYKQYLGKKIKITTIVPLLNRRNFIGTLQQVVNERHIDLLLEDGQLVSVALDNIRKGNAVAECGPRSQGGKNE